MMIRRTGPARPWAWLLIGSSCVVWAANCGPNGPTAPPSDPLACEEGGPNCAAGANTGSDPKKDAAGEDGTAPGDASPISTSTVNVSVIQFLDTDLSEKSTTPFKGVGIVSVPVPTGQTDYPIGGDAGTDLVANGVLVGAGWYQMRPTGSPDLLTTHAYLSLAADQTSLQVPVIDRVLLNTIYLQAATGVPMDPNAGQIIVRFYNSLGVTVSGVKLTFCPFTGLASRRMFDAGLGGNYVVDDNGLTTTGQNGTVIISNVTDGIGALTYVFGGVERKTPVIAWVKPQASFVRITIPD